MKTLTLLTFIFTFNAFAENSRSPAVLPDTCDLNIPTKVTKIINGKQVEEEREIKDVLKDQCIEVRKCMNSAEDEEMEDLKKLEAIACNNTFNAITTKVPGEYYQTLQNFDGKRKAKEASSTNSLDDKSAASTTIK